MEVVFTKHAKDKFGQEKYVVQLRITKRKIRQVLSNPIIEDKNRGEKITAVGELDKEHSLIVIYREEKDRRIIITFYPARKGRYESKILY